MSGERHIVRAWLSEGPYLLGSTRWRAATREDREDALSRAVCELLDKQFSSAAHARHALCQRFHTRMIDLARARSGRSADAAYRSEPLEPDQDHSSGDTPERTAIARDTLRRLTLVLSPTERAALSDSTCSPAARAKRRQRARTQLRRAA